jgi:hypothetical protein
MIAIRESLEGLPDDFIAKAHATIRKLIQDAHPVAQLDLNLAYMVRVLGERHTTQNEHLLIQLFSSKHGYGTSPAPNIQRDIMLILARWQVTYWLGDRKNYIASAEPWVKRAFLIASYVLKDEGHHWRQANRATFTPFEIIVRDWAADKRKDPSWEVPV